MAHFDRGPTGRPHATGPERPDGFPIGCGAFQPAFDTDEFRDLDRLRLDTGQQLDAGTETEPPRQPRPTDPRKAWHYTGRRRKKVVDVPLPDTDPLDPLDPLDDPA